MSAQLYIWILQVISPPQTSCMGLQAGSFGVGGKRRVMRGWRSRFGLGGKLRLTGGEGQEFGLGEN